MYLADCPNCRKAILIPGNHMKAIARCSRCEYEFSVDGLPTQEIPVVEIVRTDFTTIDGETQPVPERPLDLDLSNLEADSRPAERLAELESTNLDIPSSEEAVPTATTVSARRSAVRRGSNPIVEIAKVIGGGMAGLAIAQMILWWLPGNWRRDPFHLAPRLPTGLHFLAPERLRGIAPTSVQESRQDLDDWSAQSPQDRDVSSDFQSQNFDLGHVGLNADDATRDDGSPTGEASSDQALQFDSSSDLSDSVDPTDDIAVAQPTAEETPESAAQEPDTDIDSSSSASSVPTGESPEVNPTSDQFSQNEKDDDIAPRLLIPKEVDEAGLTLAIEPAESAVALLRDENARKKETQRQFYIALCQLAEKLSLAEETAESSQLIDRATQLLRVIADQSLPREVIGAGASGWLTYRARSSNGIAIAGLVRNIESVDHVFALRVELVGRPNRFVNVLADSLPGELEKGESDNRLTIILGLIVDNPKEKIAGYDGDATTVIWKVLAITGELSASPSLSQSEK